MTDSTRQRAEQQSGKSIVVLHAGALGDCVLTLGLVGAMRASWGAPSVGLVGRSGIVAWAQRHGLVSEAYALDSLGLHALYRADAELPEPARELFQRAHRIVSFLGGPTDPVSVRLRKLLGDKLMTLDPRPNDDTLRVGRHITQQWADDLAKLGRAIHSTACIRFGISKERRKTLRQQLEARLRSYDSEPEPQAQARRLQSIDRAPDEGRHSRIGLGHHALRSGSEIEKPITLCHPGSGGLDKCVPLEAFETLIRTLRRDGATPAWMVGPDEVERFGPSWLRRLEVSAPVIFEEKLDTAADLVCVADAYIGHDAGMTHVAALAGVRTLAIFGPTDAHIWRPVGPCCTIVGFPEAGGSLDTWVRTLTSHLWGK